MAPHRDIAGAPTAARGRPTVTGVGRVPPDRVLYVPASRERLAVRERLARLDCTVTVAADVTDALQHLADHAFAIAVVDLMDDRGAIPLIRMMRTQHPGMAVIAVADPGSPVIAAEAIQAGVADLLPWPFDDRELAHVVVDVTDRIRVDVSLEASPSTNRIYGHSPAMRHALEQLQAAVANGGPVAICGEPGTGRRLLARTIHDAACDRTTSEAQPFLILDCAEGGPQELERALFGDVTAPSTTGDVAAGIERVSRSGALVSAASGTLFLRHLSEAPARLQIRLARLLRDREAVLEETGAVVGLQVRPIAAFEATVDLEVQDGRLRPELFDRFASNRVDAPPLRRRREDVPLLAVHLLGELAVSEGGRPKSVSRSALALLGALPWPGNVPDLRNLLSTLTHTVSRPVLQLDDVLEHAQLDGSTAAIDPGVTLRDAKTRFERDCISAVLMRHHGRVGEAAKALGIQRTNLYRKVRQLNVARSLLSARK